MKFSKTLALLCAVATLVVSARAQTEGSRMISGGRLPTWMLLSRSDVQDDLKVTEQQKAKIATLQDEMMAAQRERFPGGADASLSREEIQKRAAEISKLESDKIAAILSPDQIKRLKEITVQLAGLSLVFNPEVAKELEITEEQKTKLNALRAAMTRANRTVINKMRENEIDAETAQTTMKQNVDIFNTEVEKVLTPTQREKLKEQMKVRGGAPFVRRDDGN